MITHVYASSVSATLPRQELNAARASTACWACDDDKLLRPTRRLSLSSDRHVPPSKEAPQPPVKSFVLSRWRGQVPLETVFWRDMLMVGTAINITAGVSAILLLFYGLPTAICLLIYFLPLPLNVFLFLSVWRSAGNAETSDVLVAKIVAPLWFAVMLAF